MSNGTADIHDEMLTDLPAMRLALGQRFYWFCHVTLLGSADRIRQDGLIPKDDSTSPEVVTRHLGDLARNRICFSPFGAKSVGPPVQQGTKVCLAIAREALPARVGLDWSFAGGFGIANELRRADAQRPSASIFVEAADRWGSIVVYDSIPPTVIRAFANWCPPHDLARWPLLVHTTDNDLVRFS